MRGVDSVRGCWQHSALLRGLSRWGGVAEGEKVCSSSRRLEDGDPSKLSHVLFSVKTVTRRQLANTYRHGVP